MINDKKFVKLWKFIQARNKRIWPRVGVVFIAVLTALLIAACAAAGGYRISNKDSFIPYAGGADLYNASREELAALDKCGYSESFGRAENAEQAAQIAAKVIEEVYGSDEAPYVVKYNANANAWIVSGTKKLWGVGGAASIAIDQNTGAVIMLLHTK